MRKTSLLLMLSLFNIYFSFAQTDVKNINSGTGEKIFWPREFTNYNNLMFFKSRTAGLGDEIWVSDGSSENTRLLKDINPGSGYAITTSFTASSVKFNNALYFVADDGQTGGELWKTDGTTEGTIRITDSIHADIPQLTVAGDKIFFLAIIHDPLYHLDTMQVWKSDGTKIGTSPVTGKLLLFNQPTYQGKCNNTFIFTKDEYGTNGSRVWRSSGTDAGTFPVTAGLFGNGAGFISGLRATDILSQYIEFNNYLYFVTGSGIMKTDGTTQNTQLVYGGTGAGMKQASVIELNNKLYFSFYEENNNHVSIYESDGTTEGTKQIYNQSASKYIVPSKLEKHNTSLLFTGPNSSGQTCLLSLNTADYAVSEIIVLADNPVKPNMYFEYKDACFFNPFSDNIFISVPIGYQHEGWIYNLTHNTVQKMDTLKNIWEAFPYNNKLAFYRYVNGYSDLWMLSTGLVEGIKSVSSSGRISIYPNPVHDYLNIMLSGHSGKSVDLKISNTRGQVVRTLHYGTDTRFSISDLPKGAYLLSVDKDSKQLPVKFIKN
jgi:ELWxxDGT repeat protein